MKCPACDHDKTRVIDSRPNDDATEQHQRRRCVKCGNLFFTSVIYTDEIEKLRQKAQNV